MCLLDGIVCRFFPVRTRKTPMTVPALSVPKTCHIMKPRNGPVQRRERSQVEVVFGSEQIHGLLRNQNKNHFFVHSRPNQRRLSLNPLPA
jgi:hypothetical protein